MDIRKRLLIGLLLYPCLVKAQILPSVQVYSYSVPSGGYAPNGNLLSYTDSVTGTWSAQYDGLNRLSGASAGNGPFNSAALGWTYDSFGNRTAQTVTGSPSVTVPSAWAVYDGNNRMTANQNAVTAGILSYDSAGNITFDGTNHMLYDAENRVCAVQNSLSGQITQYLYDAEGHRVAKGHPTQTGLYCATGAGDFTPDATYVLGQSGEQVSEMDGTGQWKHTNVYAAGQLIATYDQEGSQQKLHFNITDPLGTKRVQTSYAGVVELNCLSLPFGDGLTCTGTGVDATEHHFTGKERDTESGLDYFGARYYESSTGRWMSPDWAAKAQPVPYGKLDDPQSLNLYQYVGNNPLGRADVDGHCWPWCSGVFTSWVANGSVRDGGVKPFAKNVGVGLAKGAGQVGVGAASGLAIHAGVPMAKVITYGAALKATEAVTPSNLTQAQTAPIGAAITTTAVTMGISAGVGALEGAATTTLFRAVDATEAESITSTGQFLASPNGTEYKGFFFGAEDAQRFGAIQAAGGGPDTTVVTGTAPTSLVESSPPHPVISEGPGVLIKNENLPQVKPQ